MPSDEATPRSVADPQEKPNMDQNAEQPFTRISFTLKNMDKFLQDRAVDKTPDSILDKILSKYIQSDKYRNGLSLILYNIIF